MRETIKQFYSFKCRNHRLTKVSHRRDVIFFVKCGVSLSRDDGEKRTLAVQFGSRKQKETRSRSIRRRRSKENLYVLLYNQATSPHEQITSLADNYQNVIIYYINVLQRAQLDLSQHNNNLSRILCC